MLASWLLWDTDNPANLSSDSFNAGMLTSSFPIELNYSGGHINMLLFSSSFQVGLNEALNEVTNVR